MVLLFKGTLVLVAPHPGQTIMHMNWLVLRQHDKIQLGLGSKNKICGKYLQKTPLKIKWALVSTWRGLPRTMGLLVHIPNRALVNSPCSLAQNAWSFLS